MSNKILKDVQAELQVNIDTMYEIVDRYWTLQAGNTIEDKVILEARMMNLSNEIRMFENKIKELTGGEE